MTREALHRQARGVISQAFENVLGRKGTPAELQYAQAVAWLETNYGQSWKGAMAGSNNWGAVQCPLKSTGTENCTLHQDSHPDGTTYQIGFKRYDSPVAGAEDVVRHVLKNRPRTSEALTSDFPTAFRASYAMRRERYYGGFCPQATRQYGSEPARASFAEPDRDDGTRACMQEAVNGYAKQTGSLAAEIAAANSDPYALEPGSFEDADAWWFGRSVDVAQASGGSYPSIKYLAIVAGAVFGYYVVSDYVGKARA